jgi:hypothetical protein
MRTFKPAATDWQCRFGWKEKKAPNRVISDNGFSKAQSATTTLQTPTGHFNT